MEQESPALVNGAILPPVSEPVAAPPPPKQEIRHEFTETERAIVEAIKRDIQLLDQQLVGALRCFAIERKVRGGLKLANDMTHLIEVVAER